MSDSSCSYCHPQNEIELWRNDECRVLFVADAAFTGWCRVVWNAHQAELSDLTDAQCSRMMRVVAHVERQIRQLMAPDKMNVASLGTGLPHLHWHIIPRYRDDSHFPEPVWCQPVRTGVVRALPDNFIAIMQERLTATL